MRPCDEKTRARVIMSVSVSNTNHDDPHVDLSHLPPSIIFTFINTNNTMQSHTETWTNNAARDDRSASGSGPSNAAVTNSVTMRSDVAHIGAESANPAGLEEVATAPAETGGPSDPEVLVDRDGECEAAADSPMQEDGQDDDDDVDAEDDVDADVLNAAAGPFVSEVDAMIDNAGMGSVNRDRDIVTAWTTFPAMALYDDEKEGDNDNMLGQGPWFDRRAVEQGDNVQPYACDGCLPGGIQISWTDKWCWRMQFACDDEDLVIHRFRTRNPTRAEFARQVRNGIGRLRIQETVHNCEMFVYSTHGEIEYYAALSALSPDVFEGWSGLGIVTHDAWVWSKPPLRVDFRHIRKTSAY